MDCIAEKDDREHLINPAVRGNVFDEAAYYMVSEEVRAARKKRIPGSAAAFVGLSAFEYHARHSSAQTEDTEIINFRNKILANKDHKISKLYHRIRHRLRSYPIEEGVNAASMNALRDKYAERIAYMVSSEPNPKRRQFLYDLIMKRSGGDADLAIDALHRGFAAFDNPDFYADLAGRPIGKNS
jgi:hypothetical protein